MKKLLPLGLALASVLTGSHALAASATWNTTADDGNWFSAGNDWSTGAGTNPGSTTATNSSDIATFTSSNQTSIAINNATGTLNIAGISFGASTASSFTIGSTSGNAILLSASGSITFSQDTAASGLTETINAPLVLEGSYTFANTNTTNPSNLLNIGGSISNGTASAVTLNLGAGSSNNAGQNTLGGRISDGTAGGTLAVAVNNGTWVFSGNNSFSGGVTFGRGTVDINSATAMGTGVLTFANAGTFDNTSGSPVTLSTNNQIALNGAVTFTGSNSLNLGTGNVTMTAGQSGITVNGNTLTIGGTISGGIATKGFAKGGTGTLVFGGANNFVSPTSVAGGVLNYQNGTAFGSTSAITVSNGATVQVQGGIAGGGTTLTLNGAGATGATGALENVSGANSYSSSVVAASATTISSDAGSLTLTGGISGGSNVVTFTGAGNIIVSTTGLSSTSGQNIASTKSGTGTLTLNAANTNTGTMTITGGKVNLGGSWAGNFNVGNNTSVASLLSGAGTVTGGVTMATTGSNVAYIAPGSNGSGTRGDFGSAGTLTVGSLNTGSGAGTTFDFDLGTTNTLGGGVNDLITINGGRLTIGSSVIFDFNELGGSLATGVSYTLINGYGTSTLGNASFSATGLSGYSAAFSDTGGSVTVVFTATGSGSNSYYFTGSNSGSFTDAGNYYTLASGGTQQSTALSSTSNVFLNATSPTPANTPATLSGSASINSLNFVT
ncbi:MAG TPA: autotransporter-associated beta strand repeat-containing protein, partial [Lacunisphaera sp.]